MENTSIKEKICYLLESIVDKTERINKSETADHLIEVDIVLEELKSLYKEFYLLKKMTESQLEESSDKGNVQLGSKDVAGRTFPRTFVTPPPGEDQDKTGKSFNKPVDSGSVGKETKTGDDQKEKPYTGFQDSQGYSKKQPGEDNTGSKPSAEQDDKSGIPDNTVKQRTGEESAGYKPSSEPVTPSDESEKDISQPGDTLTFQEDTAGNSESKPQDNTPNTAKGAQESNDLNNKNKSIGEVVGKQQNQSVGDKYVSEEDTSLNIRLAKMKKDVDIGTSMQQRPINNLKEGIGVNEKFLFINELFGGDIEKYNEAITKLNSFNDLDEAFEYINYLNSIYYWDGQNSSETIDKFAYLVQRRYMTN